MIHLRALALGPALIAGADTTQLLWRHRRLVWEMIRREVGEQHAGQMLGAVWVIVQPLFLMAVYVFVFGVVFQSRIGGTRELPLDYTAYILSGLIPWLALQQGLVKSCGAITSNAELVKQVVFPLEVLPAKTLLAAGFSQVLSVMVLVAYTLVIHGGLHGTYALLPVLLVMQYVAGIGLGLMLAAVSVFFRDLRELVQMFSVAGLFLLPIVYLPAWVPGIFKPVIFLNPFSYLVWCYQDALYFGRIEHPEAWLLWGGFCVICFAYGARGFRAVRHMFGDAL